MKQPLDLLAVVVAYQEQVGFAVGIQVGAQDGLRRGDLGGQANGDGNWIDVVLDLTGQPIVTTPGGGAGTTGGGAATVPSNTGVVVMPGSTTTTGADLASCSSADFTLSGAKRVRCTSERDAGIRCVPSGSGVTALEDRPVRLPERDPSTAEGKP